MKQKTKYNPKVIKFIVIILVIYLILRGIGDIIDTEKTKRPVDCFYEWQLSLECNMNNGTIIPITDDKHKYWSCTKLDYKVRAC